MWVIRSFGHLSSPRGTRSFILLMGVEVDPNFLEGRNVFFFFLFVYFRDEEPPSPDPPSRPESS